MTARRTPGGNADHEFNPNCSRCALFQPVHSHFERLCRCTDANRWILTSLISRGLKVPIPQTGLMSRLEESIQSANLLLHWVTQQSSWFIALTTLESIQRQINCSFPGLYELRDKRHCETLKKNDALEKRWGQPQGLILRVRFKVLGYVHLQKGVEVQSTQTCYTLWVCNISTCWTNGYTVGHQLFTFGQKPQYIKPGPSPHHLLY